MYRSIHLFEAGGAVDVGGGQGQDKVSVLPVTITLPTRTLGEQRGLTFWETGGCRSSADAAVFLCCRPTHRHIHGQTLSEHVLELSRSECGASWAGESSGKQMPDSELPESSTVSVPTSISHSLGRKLMHGGKEEALSACFCQIGSISCRTRTCSVHSTAVVRMGRNWIMFGS